jgi:hypothetical protein
MVQRAMRGKLEQTKRNCNRIERTEHKEKSGHLAIQTAAEFLKLL